MGVSLIISWDSVKTIIQINSPLTTCTNMEYGENLGLFMCSAEDNNLLATLEHNARCGEKPSQKDVPYNSNVSSVTVR